MKAEKRKNMRDVIAFFQKRAGSFALLLTIVLSFGFLTAFYAPMVFHPNQHLFTSSGDGIKNYYTYAYHIEHDSTYRYFEGMNYPYGELHQFTDGQPLLSNTVKLLSKVFPGITYYSIGILNMLLILSFVFAAVLLYLIIREFGIPPLIAALVAFAIMTLSPQIHRWGGHLSLGYFCAFPLAFYLLIKHLKKKRWIWTILLLALNLCLLFTHPYLAVMNAAFLVMVWVWDQIILRKKEIFKSLIHVFIQAVLPFVLWMVYIKLFDHHPDRPANTFTFNGIATASGIFLPPMGDIKNLFQSITGLEYQTRWESWSYLGIVNLLVLMYMIGQGLISLIQRRKLQIFPAAFPRQFKILWLAAGFVLLYAFGVPYTTGMDFLLDWFPPLQQIRAVARFAWVFYYVTSIGSVLYLFTLLQEKKKLFTLLITIASVVFVYEGIQYHTIYKHYYNASSNVFLPDAEDSLSKEIAKIELDSSDYQAILPLPYYHLGSGVYQLGFEDKNGFPEGLIFSYKKGLPLMSVALSRTSKQETRNLLALFNPPGSKKPVIEKMSDKPVLLLVTDESKVRDRERQFLDASTLIFKGKYFDLYKLNLKSLAETNAQRLVLEVSKLDHTDKLINGSFVTDDKQSFLFKGANSDFPIHELDTSVVLCSPLTGYHKFAEYSGDEFNAGKPYELSFWFYNPGDRLFTNMFINQINHQGKEDWTDYFSLRRGTHIGNWSMVNYTFTPIDSLDCIRFVFHYQPEKKVLNYYTDFLIRPVETNVYYRLNDTVLFKNNVRITVPERFFNKISN